MALSRLVAGFVLFTLVVSASCPVLTTSDNKQVPLNQLKPIVLTINQIFGNPPNNNKPYIWSFDLCGGNAPTPTGTTKPCTSPGYVEEYSKDLHCEQTFTGVVGTPGTDWSWNGTAANVAFATSGTPAYIVYVGIICGDSTDLVSLWPAFASQAPSGQVTWGMQFSSKAACPRSAVVPPTPVPWSTSGSYDYHITIEAKAACSGGCAFVIIVFVGLFVYAVVAVLWNYFRLGKRGRELAPHPAFWTSIPGLIKDGFVFTFSKIRGLCQRGAVSAAGGYSQV